MMVSPKVLSIDFWGTLFIDETDTDAHRAVRNRAYSELLQNAGLHDSMPIADTFFELLESLVRSDWVAGRPPNRVEIVRRASTYYGGIIPEDLVERMLDLTYELYANQLLPKPIEGASEFARWASQRWPLYLNSDTYVLPGMVLDQIVQKTGLFKHFAGRLYSDQLGKSKPDQTSIEMISAREGISPAEIVHIGDMLETDGHLAMLAGATGILVNAHGARQNQENLRLDAGLLFCNDLRHVRYVLERLSEAKDDAWPMQGL